MTPEQRQRLEAVASAEWQWSPSLPMAMEDLRACLAALDAAEQERDALRDHATLAMAALDRADCTRREGGDTRHCRVDAKCWRCRAEQAEAKLAAQPLAEAVRVHRCSGCGHTWEDRPASRGEWTGAELCGDCWRKAQPVLHGRTAGCAELQELVREWQIARRPSQLLAPGVDLVETYRHAVQRMAVVDEALARFNLDGPSGGVLVGQTATPTESTGPFTDEYAVEMLTRLARTLPEVDEQHSCLRGVLAIKAIAARARGVSSAAMSRAEVVRMLEEVQQEWARRASSWSSRPMLEFGGYLHAKLAALRAEGEGGDRG